MRNEQAHQGAEGMKWINAKNEKPNPDGYLLVLLSDYENTYYYTDLKGWDEIEDIEDEYGIAWSKLPKHPDQDSTGWNVITDTPFNELDFEDEALVFIKHEDGGYMDIYCPHNACEIEPQYFGEITHWMPIPEFYKFIAHRGNDNEAPNCH